MIGLESNTMRVAQYRSFVADENQTAAAMPDTYDECVQKFALFEVRQRTKDAGISTCMLECAL